MGDIIVLSVLAGCMVLAVRSLFKARKKGCCSSCSGGCAGCTGCSRGYIK